MIMHGAPRRPTDLREPVEKIADGLEAPLFLPKQEARLVKNKIL
jgi:hypothetical protein